MSKNIDRCSKVSTTSKKIEPIKATELIRDGFIVLDSILPTDKVEAVRQDFEKLFQQDLKERRKHNIKEPHYKEGPLGHTILTEASHLALNVYDKNETLGHLLEQLFDHPTVREIIETWSGPSYRIGAVNIRYMTGNIDSSSPNELPHELHRDAPGSMNLGIMLTDVEPGNNGATALVPGSHYHSLDPRWDCLFQQPFRLRKNPAQNGIALFLRWNLFNRIYKTRYLKSLTGAFGKQGNIYFFANGEVWHGRLPNLHGRKTMICLIGFYPVSTKAERKPLHTPEETIKQIAPFFAKKLGGPFEINNPTNTILEQLYKNYQPDPLFSLALWTKLERRFAEWVSEKIQTQTWISFRKKR